MGRWRWVILVGVAALLVVVLWILLVVREYPSRIHSYRVIDERTLVVQVNAPPRGWTWVDEVVETSSAVKVSIKSFDLLPGPGTAYAISLELTVQLDQPLGDRVVQDGDGIPVVQPLCTDNECSPQPSPQGVRGG
jgi:hypothetical protein